MRTTILSALLSLTLMTNLAFGNETIITESFKATSKVHLKYEALGWGGVGGNEFCDNVFGVLLWGIISVGIAPVAGCTNSNKAKNAYLDLQINAAYSSLENGRGTIRIRSNENKNCQGFNSLIYTENDGFGGFDMYKNKEDWTNGLKIGSGTKTEKGLELSFSKERVAISAPGKKGACVYDLGENLFMELTKTNKATEE